MRRGGRYIAMGALVAAVAVGLMLERRSDSGERGLRVPVPVLPAAAPRQTTPDVLYTWVDGNGVTHYEQRRPGKAGGERVQYDGSRLTPLPPVDPALAGRIREAAGGEAASLDAGLPAQAGSAPAGGLQGLRRELQQGARQLQAARAARHPDL